MKIKTALIDLDDTISNSTATHDLGLRDCYITFKSIAPTKLTFAEFEELYEESTESVSRSAPTISARYNRALVFQTLVEIVDTKMPIDFALELYEAYYMGVYRNLKLHRNAENLLIWLKESGRKIVIVSNGSTHIRLKKLRALNITQYVDHLVTSEEVGASKPSKTPFLVALQKSDTLPSEAIMIGNQESVDIFGANQIGIRNILVDRNKQGRKVGRSRHNEPTYTVNDLIKVRDIFDFIETN